MNRLDTDTRVRVLSMLCEGMAIRPIVRATGVAKNTIQKLIREIGAACLAFHDEKVRGLKCEGIEADELWAFVGARQKHVRPERRGEWGDMWLWSSICARTKIVPAWNFGPRTFQSATVLLRDVLKRVIGRFELNTDGLRAYQTGIVCALADEPRDRQIDYARVVKSYKTPNGRWNDKHNRYEQPEISEIKKERVCGNPDTENASTSYVERLNTGIRQHTKKLSRLTNAHAKKLEMLEASQALAYCYYNWVRPHAALVGSTPAMAQGLTDRRWTVADLVGLLPN